MHSVTIVGLGTIGSPMASLVARMPGISNIVLVDPDRYAEANLATQSITCSALGRPKVEVQAAQIQAINSQIQVAAFCEPVENVPIRRLRSSIFVSCVDRRDARQSINRIAWRCGSPWIDAAINAPSQVRINAYIPARYAPCLECAWHQGSYDLLEQNYPCSPAGTHPATNAPAELGAVAAALQAAELRKLLNDGVNVTNLVGAQLMLDTTSYEKHVVSYAFNEHCRFDHLSPSVSRVSLDPQKDNLADLFDVVSTHADSTIKLEGHSFATHLDCVDCGRRSCIGLSLYRRLSENVLTCSCGGKMFATGFFSFEAISRADLSPSSLHLKLTTLGLRDGDVVTVDDASGSSHHLEIGTLHQHE